MQMLNQLYPGVHQDIARHSRDVIVLLHSAVVEPITRNTPDFHISLCRATRAPSALWVYGVGCQ